MSTLLGHSDYIRTTFFHNSQPWIISASDDQTVRIWNWQSRNCIAVLSGKSIVSGWWSAWPTNFILLGHTHYVKCAKFHPTEELVVSASIDQTIRLWTIHSLFDENIPASTDGSNPSFPKITEVEMLGRPAGVVKYIIQAHDKGAESSTRIDVCSLLFQFAHV